MRIFPIITRCLLAVLLIAAAGRIYSLWDSTALAAEEEKTEADAAPALQKLPTQEPNKTKAEAKVTTPPVKDADPLAEKDLVDFSSSEISLLQSLRQRREDLAKREAAVQEKERLLAAMDSKLSSKVQKLEEIKGQIESTRTDIEKLVKAGQGQDDARIASLVRVYEKMKPKEAARIFDNLDLTILLDVVRKMNEGRLAPILASMNPDKATTVTATLGQRTKMPELASAAAAESSPSPKDAAQ